MTMDWFQTTISGHQLLGDNSRTNFRKGYKVTAVNKDSDPDKSDTPLLHEAPKDSGSTKLNADDWCDDISSLKSKKSSLITKSSTSKPGFLGSSIFEKTGTNMFKSSSNARDAVPKAPNENNTLLKTTEPNSGSICGFEDDDSFSDEDTEWGLPLSSASGYQKIKPGAD